MPVKHIAKSGAITWCGDDITPRTELGSEDECSLLMRDHSYCFVCAIHLMEERQRQKRQAYLDAERRLRAEGSLPRGKSLKEMTA